MVAYANTGNWGVGGFALVGFADQDDLRQLPDTANSYLYYKSDTGGINGGLGGWISYDIEEKTDLPITVEFAVTWRFRHDLNIHYDRFTTYHARFITYLNIMMVDTMLSGLYHIKTGTPFTPYVGAMAFV